MRITITVSGVALIALGALAWLATGLVGITITGAVDVELARAAATATGRLSAGVPEDSVVPPDSSLDGVSGQIAIRVSDTAGRPLDDGPQLPLDGVLLRRLAAGDSVTVDGPHGPTRWLGVVAIAPDGTPRLVLAAADMVGYNAVLRRGATGLGLAALLAGMGVALAAWTAVGLALRPVDRMRGAATTLPAGKRLPVPPARDELRALAEELNELLARRDNASARLERFTGDAAHELRSPVASIRAQAEVAVVHPDPALAEETLRSVATEAARLSELLSDLLALARADAGARPPASPVDLVAEARTAIARAAPVPAGVPDDVLDQVPGAVCEGDPVAITLTAPVPVWAAASPGEVALVLDNLLTNARRYARDRVWVSVLPAGRDVRLVVDDDGPGVPECDRQRVFDRFTRLEADRGGKSGGAGLGLALVSALVTGRGGTVRMAAGPNGGARAEVRWPVAAGPDEDEDESDLV
ncbi:MAG TPA: HAMP domain-containing sensor histidine kinase [Pseudonocardia sp.]